MMWLAGEPPCQFLARLQGVDSTVTLPNGVPATYRYDAASHLTGITYTNGSRSIGNLAYSYDQNGNRIQVGGTLASTGLPAAVATATHNEDNRLGLARCSCHFLRVTPTISQT